MSATLPTRGWPSTRTSAPSARAVPESSPAAFVLVLAVVTVLAVMHLQWADRLPLMSFVPLCLGATLFLPTRQVLIVLGYAALWVSGLGIFAPDTRQVTALMLMVSIVLMAAVAYSRGHHGVKTFAGDRMLRELRDRLARMGEMPPLPPGWRAERAFASAHGHGFAGDFNVTALDRDAATLEVVLTDVSGKGQRAGTRALVLGGVMSGLLGSAPFEKVLPMTNTFLDRERWDEGFATAVHVRVDLTSGEVLLSSAGHPAAVHYSRGCGRWRAVPGGRGPALGMTADAQFPQTRLTLGKGDALLICTDGVIESRGATIDDGIDWMLGAAEASLVSDPRALAQHLVSNGRAGSTDDRAAVVLWRE